MEKMRQLEKYKLFTKTQFLLYNYQLEVSSYVWMILVSIPWDLRVREQCLMIIVFHFYHIHISKTKNRKEILDTLIIFYKELFYMKGRLKTAKM